MPLAGPEDVLNFAQTMTFHAVSAYWSRLDTEPGESQALPLRTPPPGTNCQSLPAEAQELADSVGRNAAGLEALHAAHALGSLYTETMPAKLRSGLGAYHTAPALCERLLDMAEDAGVDWSTARVMDPASGGGAFLAPCARRMLKNTPERDAGTKLQGIEERLHGAELDPFAAWMSRVFLDEALRDLQNALGRRPGPAPTPAVNVGNALETSLGMEGFDLVIGNPPRGRVSLPPHLRRAYERSLSGHANMYGLFMDLALRLTRPGGTVALITPTSFLAGQYFRGLRKLMAQEAPITRIEFITPPTAGAREGDQETALIICRRSAGAGPGSVGVSTTEARRLLEPMLTSKVITVRGGGHYLDASGRGLLAASQRRSPSQVRRRWGVYATKGGEYLRAQRLHNQGQAQAILELRRHGYPAFPTMGVVIDHRHEGRFFRVVPDGFVVLPPGVLVALEFERSARTPRAVEEKAEKYKRFDEIGQPIPVLFITETAEAADHLSELRYPYLLATTLDAVREGPHGRATIEDGVVHGDPGCWWYWYANEEASTSKTPIDMWSHIYVQSEKNPAWRLPIDEPFRLT